MRLRQTLVLLISNLYHLLVLSRIKIIKEIEHRIHFHVVQNHFVVKMRARRKSRCSYMSYQVSSLDGCSLLNDNIVEMSIECLIAISMIYHHSVTIAI